MAMSAGDFRAEFRVSRNKLVHGVVIASLLLAVGVWLLLFADPSIAHAELFGLMTLALAAVVLAVALSKVRDPRPHLLLDREGIWYRDWGLAPVPWREIRDVYSSGSRIQAFACVELRDSQFLIGRLDEHRRRKLVSNRLVRPPRLLVPNGALEGSLLDILAALRTGLETYRR